MTLEIEKLTNDLEEMARNAAARQANEKRVIEAALEKLRQYRDDWDFIEQSLAVALDTVDIRQYRCARPFDEKEPLDAAIVAGAPLPQATLIATDGSQIVPDRHAPYLYSLINIGVVVYFHGRGMSPEQFTEPVLDYPEKALADEAFADRGAIVNLRRDRAEIEVLARTAWAYREEIRPLLAILDQRLLYWPVVGDSDNEGKQVLTTWQQSMTKVRDAGGFLAGYIDRPGKKSILTLLDTFDIHFPTFDKKILEGGDAWGGLTDASLFGRILKPGERSKVFIDISHHNNEFRANDPDNEVCFFYLNPGQQGRGIARVDIPRSVAEDETAVSAVHSLIYDQCKILGGYPYIITRADEQAVVTFRDKEHLDIMIGNKMQQYDISSDITAKQSGKNVARGSKSRFEV
ncbi:MAG: DNA double-strand break repair nuclease NurA [Candidatus Promineifilaceae bacterium]